MAEAKPTASLSSGLLARKGAARPAMRRQGLGGHIASPHDDLGWNDMGHEPDKDEHDSHAAHVADIMPMLSPMGAKPVALPLDRDADSPSDDAGDQQESSEAPDNVSSVARSPLSVKPGKPQVVLQREALEDRVRGPAPVAPAAPVAQETAADVAEPEAAEPDAAEPLAVEAQLPEAPEPVVAEVAPKQPTPRPAAKPAAEEPRQAQPSEPKKSRPRGTARAAGAKAAFTLRIDADRHLRLRLASAVTNLSAQQILTEAFDAYLESLPEVETLAGNVARHNADRH